MRGLRRPTGLVAALACAFALAACGGSDGGADVGALTGCLEDAGMKAKRTDVDKSEAKRGLTDTVAAGSPGGAIADQIQMGVFDSADNAEKYAKEFGAHMKQVDSILIFAINTESKEYDKAVSCAQEATG